MNKTESLPLKPPPSIGELREYLAVASLDENTAQKYVLIKLLKRLPLAASWLASLMDNSKRKAEFLKLISRQSFADADAESLELDEEDMRELSEAAGMVGSGDRGYGGLSELELSAVVALAPKSSKVLSLSDRWLMTTAASAEEREIHPARHILPMLEFAERMLGKNAGNEMFNVARAALKWEKSKGGMPDEDHWRKHVWRYLFQHRTSDSYDVHAVLNALPPQFLDRAESRSDKKRTGNTKGTVRAVDVYRFLTAIGVRCEWKKKPAGRKKKRVTHNG